MPDEGEEFVFDVFGIEEIVFTSDECTSGLESIKVEDVRDGEAQQPSFLVRGDACLQQVACPDGTQCDDCNTVWCDDPPPPCDG